MAEKANFKTNALRILETLKINYTLHKYDHDDEFAGGISIAEKLGQVFGGLLTMIRSGMLDRFNTQPVKDGVLPALDGGDKP